MPFGRSPSTPDFLENPDHRQEPHRDGCADPAAVKQRDPGRINLPARPGPAQRSVVQHPRRLLLIGLHRTPLQDADAFQSPDEILGKLPKYWTKCRNTGSIVGMDLQHPLRSLVPSRDWVVLEVLASTQSGLGASQIARLSHEGSRSGQAPILDRLVEQGLVIAEPANHGFLYRLNRDHLLAPAVLHAAGLRAQLLKRLGEQVAQLAPAPVHASVFGSFARGEANDESDIDILLIADSDQDVADWDTQIDLLQERVQLWTGNRCSCMAFSVERAQQLVAQEEPIVDNWVKDALVLIGDPLQRILDIPAKAGVRRATVRR